MGKALYRKYRSRSLSEIVGQEHITSTLQNALKQGGVSHAYLFTGPRGVGKTSVARILAYAINDIPYTDEDETHLDIIEIDAASNRRIDEIRTLRERIHNAPTSASYKVYIIDEVHMLTKEAFNALLKTLEEPPAHVVFILATTEVHKLPETIVSRTQRFNFRPIDNPQAVKHLQGIAKKENIDIDTEALELISAHSRGSFRDSISLLDQVRHIDHRITAKDIQAMLGIAPTESLEKLITGVAHADTASIVNTLKNIQEQGFQASMVAKQLATLLREALINDKHYFDYNITTNILKELIEVPVSHDPVSYLELALLSAATKINPGSSHSRPQSQLPTQPEQTIDKQTTPNNPESNQTPSSTKPKKPQAKSESKADKAPEVSNTAANESPKSQSSKLDADAWQSVLDAVKQKHNTLYSILRMATPKFDKNTVVLLFDFPFHQKRINEDKNKQAIIGIVHSSIGQDVELVCELATTQSKKPDKPDTTPKTDDSVDTISNIFGSAEVLES
ncbi:MAG: DNA polymerase III subunit gamma/tau [Candidatus Saccharibacteria bacterium]|nr:DNA polymerase III subunit gamma/tau [Candidatus Saccharibacteria bacterium]